MLFEEIPIIYWAIIFIIIVILFIFQRLKKKQVIIDYFDITTDKTYKNSTILDILKTLSKNYKYDIALQYKQDNMWKQITYNEYYKKVLNFAMATNYWLGSNANVAIIGTNSCGWFYSHLGCMLNGGSSIGIYPTATSDICQHILKNSNAQLLVVEDDIQLSKFIDIDISSLKMIIYYAPIKGDIIEKFKIPVVSMGNFMLNKNKLIFTPKLNDIATIIYTSGTTGMPKGAVITHKNIMSSVKKLIEFYSLSNLKTYKEDIISYLPLNHIAGQLLDIYLPIATVSTVWFADKDALKGSLPITIKEVRPTIFAGVPRVWEKIADELTKNTNKIGIIGKIIKSIYPKRILKGAGLDRCKLFITMAAPISIDAKKKLKDFGIKLYDIYGMSETTGPISISAPNNYKEGSVGKPIMEIKISRNKEILVKGNNLFKEYNDDIKETKSSFINGWFRTGDLGYIDTDGFLYITGREKELIITTGGENISPLKIEEEIKKYFGNTIENAVVIGDKKKYLIAILNIKPTKKDIINNMLETGLYTINKNFNTTNQIKKFLIIDTPFEIGKELTPTYKLRRNYINEAYKEKIENIYNKV